ncbi:hypothetical protein AMAG_00064 [Allomyces macrogynus ATCC 38327]|uniref:DOMON domain-containing protein n=1 Tax=Allomyces macrogynus (strain ATCC 38327) TaxID=578462 RepID=A0A0L0RUL2_ALLM3|nr:hypothetical protein AMAG_00064 [Allomyces macrogynus ATCC 38327]|eukprot:KNE54062.1 hypothetical protein AMAG_00064 [Allomyces macrogynus ATCC 38327]
MILFRSLVSTFWALVAFTIAAFFLLDGAQGAKRVMPATQPLCNGDGGMFGYSVHAVTVSGWTYLAVGQPWDVSVHIYKTPYSAYAPVTYVNATCPPDAAAYASSTVTTATATTTTTAPAASVTPCTTVPTASFPGYPSTAWTLVTTLTDPSNSTTTAFNGTQAGSALSLFGYDVKWSTDGTWLAVGVPGRAFTSGLGLSKHPYHGSVLIYRRTGDVLSRVTELSVSQLGRTRAYHDRFGSKVVFSPDASSAFLFVTANGGWDTVSSPDSGAIYGRSLWTGAWPGMPTRFTGNMGVYVFSLNGGAWTPFQFIPSASAIPLGTLGLDIAVAATSDLDTTLAVRDYTASASSNMTAGLVSIYRLNLNSFARLTSLAAPDYNQSSTWMAENWFGLGLALTIDATAQLALLHVGAPRGGNSVTQLVSTKWKYWDAWTWDTSLTNPSSVSKTFFGGSMVATDKWLLVADATSGNGRGTVYLYHRRRLGELAFGFEDVTLSAVPGSRKAVMDWIGTLSPNASAIDTATYHQDHFGKAMTASGNVIVVGAPVDNCVYTFNVPALYTNPNATLTDPGDNNITKITDPNSGAGVSTDNTVKYALLGSILSLVMIVPTVTIYVMRSHKRQLLTRLNQRGMAGGAAKPGMIATSTPMMMGVDNQSPLTASSISPLTG